MEEDDEWYYVDGVLVEYERSRADGQTTVQGNSKFLTRLCVKHGTMKKTMQPEGCTPIKS